MHEGVQEQALGVYEDMALLATELQPSELDRLIPRIEATAYAVERLVVDLASLTARLGIGPAVDRANAERVLNLLRAVQALPPGAFGSRP